MQGENKKPKKPLTKMQRLDAIQRIKTNFSEAKSNQLADESVELPTQIIENSEIIRAEFTSAKGKSEVVFYEIDKSDEGLLGKGSFGDVYKAYPIDTETGKRTADHPPLAAKQVARQSFIAHPEELKIQKQFYHTSEAVHTYKERVQEHNTTYVLTELIPGDDLCTWIAEPKKIHGKKALGTHLPNKYKNLTFEQRIELISSLMMAVNTIHSEKTDRSGGASVMHLDLKLENIMLGANASGRSDLAIVDFGLALSEPQDSKTITLPNGVLRGTEEYMAPEIITENKYGLASDIFSLTAVISYMLGADNPMKHKDQVRSKIKFSASFIHDTYLGIDRHLITRLGRDKFHAEKTKGEWLQLCDYYKTRNPGNDDLHRQLEEFKSKINEHDASLTRQFAQARYDYDDLKNPSKKHKDLSTVELIKTFLDRMQSREPADRPDSSQCLKFFSTLGVLCKALKQSESKSKINECRAKLILLANGLWDTKLGEEKLKDIKIDLYGKKKELEEHKKKLEGSLTAQKESDNASDPGTQENIEEITAKIAKIDGMIAEKESLREERLKIALPDTPKSLAEDKKRLKESLLAARQKKNTEEVARITKEVNAFNLRINPIQDPLKWVEIQEQVLALKSKEEFLETETINKTFDTYDFGGNSAVTEWIVKLQEKTILTVDSVTYCTCLASQLQTISDGEASLTAPEGNPARDKPPVFKDINEVFSLLVTCNFFHNEKNEYLESKDLSQLIRLLVDITLISNGHPDNRQYAVIKQDVQQALASCSYEKNNGCLKSKDLSQLNRLISDIALISDNQPDNEQYTDIKKQVQQAFDDCKPQNDPSPLGQSGFFFHNDNATPDRSEATEKTQLAMKRAERESAALLNPGN